MYQPVLISTTLVFVSIVLALIKTKYGSLLVSITCFGGIIGTCQFFPETRHFGFGLNGKFISFEVYSLILFIANLVLTLSEHRRIFRRGVKN